MENLRIIETLDEDRNTVNVWNIPDYITLDMTIKRQDNEKFRALYFVSSHAKEGKK